MDQEDEDGEGSPQHVPAATRKEGIRREASNRSMVVETADETAPLVEVAPNKKEKRQVIEGAMSGTDDTTAMSHSSDSTFEAIAMNNNNSAGDQIQTATTGKEGERISNSSTIAAMDTSTKSSQQLEEEEEVESEYDSSGRPTDLEVVPSDGQFSKEGDTSQEEQHKQLTSKALAEWLEDSAATGDQQQSAIEEEEDSKAGGKALQDGDPKPTGLSEKQRMLRMENSLDSLPLPSATSPELEKIMEAQNFLDTFGEGTRNSFTKDGQPHMSSERRRRKQRPSKTRRTQSLGENMMLRQSFLNNINKNNSNNNDKEMTITVLSKEEEEEERAKAIREILGEYSSADEEEEEEEKREEEEPPLEKVKERAPGGYNSYAARVARKQRDMDVSAASASSTSNRSSTTRADARGKRALFGDVQAEIAIAQQRSQQSRRNLKATHNTAAAASSASTTTPPPRPRPALAHYSSKHSVQTEISAVSSMDDSFVSHATGATTTNGGALTNPSASNTTAATTSESAATTLTPFQQMQQQLQQNPGRSMRSNGNVTSSITSQSQPGAYPTAGRAPFANPYMRGSARSAPTLFGETITAHNSNSNNNTNNESISELGADLSMSQQIVPTLGNSSRQVYSGGRRRAQGDQEDHDADDRISDLGEEDEEIVAVCVEEDDLENNIRDEIIRSAAQADVVNLDEDKDTVLMKQLRLFTYCLSVVVLVAVAVGLSVGFIMRDDDPSGDAVLEDEGGGILLNISEAPSLSPTATPIPTLEKVREQGVLRCGIYETTGFDEESGERFGVDADWCRAIAAAVHGKDSYAVILVNVTFADRFELIANGDIDVLTASSTFTMDRNVYEVGVKTGLTFSPPFMYDGMRFAGVPEFVECADNDMKNFFECRDIMVCVVGGTSYQLILASRLPKRQIVIVDGWQTLYGGLREGLCNVIAAEGVSLGENNVRAFGYLGNYTKGRSLYSKIPLSIVTRDDDPQWSDFVASVLQSTFVAEQEGITQETSYLVSDEFISGSNLFGDGYEKMFENVIATIGNYGELYARHAESTVTREGLTLLNNGSSGLLFANPFGFVQNVGPGPLPGGTLERIIQRGKLRCAIRPGRPGFAEVTRGIAGPRKNANLTHTGFDVDFCRALATSIFSGSVDLVDFVDVLSEESGFAALAEGEVDVLSGGSWTLQNDVKEPTTGQGFSFSQPYFYGAEIVADIVGAKRGLDDNLCMVTRQDDPQWSTYVYWLVASTFYAEEMGIDQRLSHKMPKVQIFGPTFLRMLRDPILEFGNVGELYERNLQALTPRGGRNMINSIRAPRPQIYPLPGMMK